MPTVMPHGELLRRAIEWIMNNRADDKQRPLHSLLDEAGMRFNLTPADTQKLAAFLRASHGKDLQVNPCHTDMQFH